MKITPFAWKIIYLVSLCILLWPLSALSRPATYRTSTSSGSAGGTLARLRAEHKLSQTDIGQIDPTSEAMRLGTLGMGGIATNVLWHKADEYSKKKNWTALSATCDQIARMEPNFVSVWRFQGWNQTFNVSVEWDDYRDRYFWVLKGMKYLDEGVKYNQNDSVLVYDFHLFSGMKIGHADEKKEFREMFRKDRDFHSQYPTFVPPLNEALWENWLTAKESMRHAEHMVDEQGAKIAPIGPLLFYSDGAKCQMNFAADLVEQDGVFGERARQAWDQALKDWQLYGQKKLPTSFGITIRLNDLEDRRRRAQELVAKLDAIAPGARKTIEKEKREALTPEAREALDTPVEKRTNDQWMLIAPANDKIRVKHVEVAERAPEARQAEAMEMAKRATELEREAETIRHNQDIVAFKYWRERAEMERTEHALTSRRLMHEAGQAFSENADLVLAKQKYEEAFKEWKHVVDDFTTRASLVEDKGTLDKLKQETAIEVMANVERYREVLHQLDEPFPKDFVLQDLVDEAKAHMQPPAPKSTD